MIDRNDLSNRICVVSLLIMVLIFLTSAFTVVPSSPIETLSHSGYQVEPVSINFSTGSLILGDLHSVNNLDEDSEGGIAFERFSSEDGLSPGSIMNICQVQIHLVLI